jgi:hypothetical protein
MSKGLIHTGHIKYIRGAMCTHMRNRITSKHNRYDTVGLRIKTENV